MRIRNHQLGAALRFLIRILEALTDIDFRLQREIRSIACDVCGADVMKTAARYVLDQIQNIARTVDIHPKDFCPVFLLKRERCRRVPHFVCRRSDLRARSIIQAQLWQ